MWFVAFLLIIFLDRTNKFMIIITLSLLFLMTFITIIRSLNSRNEWRKLIEEGDVEIKDKIKF